MMGKLKSRFTKHIDNLFNQKSLDKASPPNSIQKIVKIPILNTTSYFYLDETLFLIVQ